MQTRHIQLKILNRGGNVSVKKTVIRTCFWIGLALIFNVGVYFFMGQEKGLLFLTGYVIELSMSIDNLFVFLLIFISFQLNEQCQRRVLNYGIIGAIVLRFVFILLGVTLVNKFEWVLYLMGAFLIYSGISVFKAEEEEDEKKDYSQSMLFKITGKIFPMSDELNGDRFFVKKNKRHYATPLLAIVVLIELSDIVFNFDSVPAILSITRDTFIVYTSNIFATMGLYSLYFLLEKLNKICRFVKFGVGFILIFVGIKLAILVIPSIGKLFGVTFHYNFEISTVMSISIIFAILFISVVASLAIKEKPAAEEINQTVPGPEPKPEPEQINAGKNGNEQ